MKFLVELIWTDEQEGTAASIYLTADGRVLLQGETVSEEERARLDLPRDVGLIKIDRSLIKAIKEML